LGLLQVQIAFEIAKDLIVDAPVAAQAENRSPLHAKQLL
jgi:hypothetical protein